MNSGVIVGIAGGSVVLVLVLGILTIRYCQQQRNPKETRVKQEEEPAAYHLLEGEAGDSFTPATKQAKTMGSTQGKDEKPKDVQQAAPAPEHRQGLEGGIMFKVYVDDAAQRSDPLGLVPVPVRTCCRWIEEHALAVEGVFRIPGDIKRVEAIVHEFNQDFNYQLPSDEEVSTVVSLITYFTREHRDEKGQPQSFGSFARRGCYKLTKLPPEAINRETASFLMTFTPATRETLWEIVGTLKKVTDEQPGADGVAINKMTPRKIALCVFPDIMSLVERMIVHYEELYQLTHAGP